MSIKKVIIDLNINKNFINFLRFFKENTISSLEEMNTHLLSSMDDHYQNDIGHSHSFSEIIQECLNSFQNLTSIDYYLNYQLQSLSEYTVWKPIFNRNLNYNNEQNLLNSIKISISEPILKIRQVVFYYSLIWIDSSITTFDDTNYVQDINSKISKDVYYKGIINFMEIKHKKLILNSFTEIKNSFDRIYFEFQNFYNNITKNNESLNSLRNSYTLILEILKKIYILFQNSKDELMFLISDTETESILNVPLVTQYFRQQIEEISGLLLELNNEINALFQII